MCRKEVQERQSPDNLAVQTRRRDPRVPVGRSERGSRKREKEVLPELLHPKKGKAPFPRTEELFSDVS